MTTGIKVLTFIFIFLIRIRFPKGKSIAEIIRKRYGNETVKLLRKLERLDLRSRKLTLDLEFLNSCVHNAVFPNFLRLRLPNKHLQNSSAATTCKKRLLHSEIQQKKSSIRSLNADLLAAQGLLQATLSFLDFAHVRSLFLVGNDRILKKQQETQHRKLSRLLSDKSMCSNDPDKVIFNFSSHPLSFSEKSLLAKGLNFSLPPSKLHYSQYLVNFELFYRDLIKQPLVLDSLDPVKTRLKDIALSSLSFYNKNKAPNNLCDAELRSLRDLSNQKNLVIQKSDKGNSVVVLDKPSYLAGVNNLLSDTNKFKEVPIQDGKELNLIINQEKKIKKTIFDLHMKNCFTQQEYHKLSPVGSKPGILYGLCKVHKPTQNGCPPFRPILSAIGTPQYSLAKFLVPLLAPLTTNEHTIKDSFSFASEIVAQSSQLHMASLDVDSLFTNIPLQETFDICIQLLFQNSDCFNGFSRSQFRSLLELATLECYFMFDGKFYKQLDGVAMGSPLGPTLANIFLSYHEKVWLQDCPSSFKPLFYRRYVDDIFVLFFSEKHLESFRDFLNSRHRNMYFTSETEVLGTFPFLDIKVSREHDCFVTSVYRKPTFSGVFSNYSSFIPTSYKFGLVYTLVLRCFRICSNSSLFAVEAVKLREILSKNGYPVSFIDGCVRKVLLRLCSPKVVVSTCKKKDIFIVLPYLGMSSLAVKTRILRCVSGIVPHCNVRVIFKSHVRLANFFRFKDRLPKCLRSGVIYKFKCSSCNATYIGKTSRHFKVRACEHLGISPLTGKKLADTSSSAVRDHLLSGCDRNTISLDCFTVMSCNSNNFNLELQESLLISRDRPLLNKQVYSRPLSLFS